MGQALKNKEFKDELLQELEPYCILKGYRGSIAHNTYDPTVTEDDKDVMGVFVPPEDIVFGIRNMETVERMWEEKLSQKTKVVWDVVYYTVPKYIRLLLKQNPNVIMLMWLAEKHYIKKTALGMKLIDNRDKLLSKHCYQSFSGYAYGQLHRMTHHTPTGKMGAKRKKLVEKFGYDTKNASHCIRLLKMGMETLATGEMFVERPDNNMLLEIKRGEWELQRVLEYADDLFGKMESALISSELPNKVSEKFANELCIEIIREFYNCPEK